MRPLPLLVLLSLTACPKRVETMSAPSKPIRLLAETAERETTRLTEKREDLRVDTDFERTPRVVATGETPVLTADGADVRLYGDEAATKGFSVDNFILFEVLGADGTVLHRVIVGYADGVSLGRERIDLLSRRSFSFEPGEVNLVSVVPEKGPFRIRATALDNGGVGRVSDVYLRIEPRARTTDDLQER